MTSATNVKYQGGVFLWLPAPKIILTEKIGFQNLDQI